MFSYVMFFQYGENNITVYDINIIIVNFAPSVKLTQQFLCLDIRGNGAFQYHKTYLKLAVIVIYIYLVLSVLIY